MVCLTYAYSLHDLRASSSVNAVFRDPVDTFSPIYSLLPVGNQRFVAGGGRHSIIKIFDLRRPGDQLYHTAVVNGSTTTPKSFSQRSEQNSSSQSFQDNSEAKTRQRGWNLFLNLSTQRSRRESPVYTLSRPSQCSPSFFAGIEGNIIQIDLVSILDRHPDPLFTGKHLELEDGDDIRGRWDPKGEAIPLSMYEHDIGPVKLFKQRPRLEYSRRPFRPGWDERWFTESS